MYKTKRVGLIAAAMGLIASMGAAGSVSAQQGDNDGIAGPNDSLFRSSFPVFYQLTGGCNPGSWTIVDSNGGNATIFNAALQNPNIQLDATGDYIFANTCGGQTEEVTVSVTVPSVPPGSAPGAGGANAVGLNGSVDFVFVAGSDTLYDLTVDLASRYNRSDGCELTGPSEPWNGVRNNSCLPYGTLDVAGNNEVVTENWDHDLIVNFFPQGSGNGQRKLCGQDEIVTGQDLNKDGDTEENFEYNSPINNRIPIVHLSRSSSGPASGRDCDSGETLRFVEFAQESLTWVVTIDNTHTTDTNGDNIVDQSLTQGEVTNIFVDCTIDEWDDPAMVAAGFTGSGAIEVWGIQEGSGTHDSWELFIGGTDDACVNQGIRAGGDDANVDLFENNCSPILGSPLSADSMWGHGTGPWAFRDAGTKCLLGQVDGSLPVGDATFPWTRAVNLVYRVANGTNDLGLPGANALRFGGENGWICKAPSLHSRPTSAAGVFSGNFGVVNPNAQTNYADDVIETMVRQGFSPVKDPSLDQNRCNVTDVVSTGTPSNV